MDMEINVGHVQEQKLIITQKMQLSIKLLQMSSAELQEYADSEFISNPLLEYDQEDSIDYGKLAGDLEYNDYNDANENTDNALPLENFGSNRKSLKEYLIEQLNDSPNLDEYLKNVCIYLIEGLNEDGYLDVSEEELCSELKLSEDMVRRAVAIVQSLEPAGIGAKNLCECLKLQISAKGLEDENIMKIVDEFLPLIAQNNYVLLGKYLGISANQAQKYGDIIKSLEPRPSNGFFTGNETNYNIPDAYIRKIGSQYHVIINESITPKLMISRTYKDILLKDKKEAKFIKQKLDSALFLIECIEKRKNTLRKTLEKIIEKQRDYFEYGAEMIKPMTFREIAESINIHESTICRTVRNKYISSSRGILSLKALFTNGISSSLNDSGKISTLYVKNIIKELVESENKQAPFSDQYLSIELKRRGMYVARRTVAKYREELNIKPSSSRKVFSA